MKLTYTKQRFGSGAGLSGGNKLNLAAIAARVGEMRLASLIAGYLSVANPTQAEEPDDVIGAREAWPETYEAGIVAARLELAERAKRYEQGWKIIASRKETG